MPKGGVDVQLVSRPAARLRATPALPAKPAQLAPPPESGEPQPVAGTHGPHRLDGLAVHWNGARSPPAPGSRQACPTAPNAGFGAARSTFTPERGWRCRVSEGILQVCRG